MTGGVTPKRTLSFSWKQLCAFSLAAATVLFAFTSFGVLATHGSGSVSKLVNRGGHVRDEERNRLPSGLFIELEDGSQLRSPPTRLFQILKPGDIIEKRRGSYVYIVNSKAHNTLWRTLGGSLVFGTLAFLLGSGVKLIAQRKANLTMG